MRGDSPTRGSRIQHAITATTVTHEPAATIGSWQCRTRRGWQPDTPLSQRSSSTPSKSMRPPAFAVNLPVQLDQKDRIVGEAQTYSNVQNRLTQGMHTGPSKDRSRS